MTILPKRKTTQAKAEVEVGPDQNPHHVGGGHGPHPNHPQASEPLNHDRLYVPGQNSPPRWPLSASREEKRPAHSSPSHFDDYDSLESGPSHSKRRHRASPHRSVRSKHRERELREHREHRERNTSSPTFSGASGVLGGALGGSSPIPGPSSADGNEDVSGYNSGDEYGAACQGSLSEEQWEERDRWFEKKMRKKGLIIKKMGEDGACLFRAVADQVYGDQDMHSIVRKHCMDYVAANSDYFSHYVTEDFDTYVNRKRLDNVHGNHIEMQAMSEMYNRAIEVFCYSTEPINIFHSSVQKSDNEPMRLSYHRGVHYNSIVDPYKATIGVGLGLPGFTPGMADKTLVKEAVRQSEDLHIEQAMLEDKMKATDWEATNEAIEEQVARESYLQWLKDNEKRNKNMHRSATATSSSAATVTSSGEGKSPRNRNNQGSGTPPHHSDPHRNSPKLEQQQQAQAQQQQGPSQQPQQLSPVAKEDCVAGCSSSSSFVPSPSRQPGHSAASTIMQSAVLVGGGETGKEESAQGSHSGEAGFQLLETASFLNQLPPEMFGLTEWEDAGLLAQVLAASQQEYLDSLKKGRETKEASDGGGGGCDRSSRDGGHS